MNTAELAQLAELHHLQYEHALLKMLDHLHQLDPEAAGRAIFVFGDKAKTETI